MMPTWSLEERGGYGHRSAVAILSQPFGSGPLARRVAVRERILFNVLQAAVVLIFAPLASGVLSRLKEIVQSKRGPVAAMIAQLFLP